MSDEKGVTISTGKIMDWAKNVLVILVIPVLGWAWSLDTNVAKLELTIKVQQKEISSLKAKVKENRSVEKAVQQNTIMLAKLGVQLDGAIKAFDGVKRLMERMARRPSRGTSP